MHLVELELCSIGLSQRGLYPLWIILSAGFETDKVRVPNLGRFLFWDKAIFQGTLSCISTVYTAHTQHYLRYPHTKCLAREDSGNPFADIEVL